MEFPQINISQKTWDKVFQKIVNGEYPPNQRYIPIPKEESHQPKPQKRKPQKKVKKAQKKVKKTKQVSQLHEWKRV